MHDINTFKGCSLAIVFLLDKDQPDSVRENDNGKAIGVHGARWSRGYKILWHARHPKLLLTGTHQKRYKAVIIYASNVLLVFSMSNRILWLQKQIAKRLLLSGWSETFLCGLLHYTTTRLKKLCALCMRSWEQINPKISRHTQWTFVCVLLMIGCCFNKESRR